MHILITGAAGMIGRKLTARLVADGGLDGKPIDGSRWSTSSRPRARRLLRHVATPPPISPRPARRKGGPAGRG